MKPLEYPLPALTLSYKQCNKLMKTIKQGLLTKATISRSISSSALYGPVSKGGLALNHLYVTPGLIKILGSKTVSGKLLTVIIDLSILEICIGRNLFHLESNKFQILRSESWIKSLWDFSSQYGITIID